MQNYFIKKENTAVLIVETSSTVRQMITDIVRDLGFENIQVAVTGKDAVKVLEVEKIHWLIMPLMSNGPVNALQILKLITETVKLRHTHVTLLIDKDQEDYCLSTCFELGLFSCGLVTKSV